MKKINKKAMSLSDAPTLIITFLVVVVIGSLAGTTLASLQDTQAETASATDEVTLLNGTAVSLTNTDVLSVSLVTNTTVNLTSGNYTVQNSAGTITLIDNTYNNSDWNVTYTYTDSETTAASITGDGITGIENLTDLFPVIGVILGIVMILVVIFMLWNPAAGRI